MIPSGCRAKAALARMMARVASLSCAGAERLWRMFQNTDGDDLPTSASALTATLA
jgi:hypothetical protein